jgi:hypothetical protein
MVEISKKYQNLLIEMLQRGTNLDNVYNSLCNFGKISEKCHELQIRLLNLKFHKIEENIFGHKFYLGKSNLESEFFASIGKIRENKIKE